MDLSIVIVSWNVCHLLERTLASLPAAVGDLAWEAIVVDNGSTDGTVDSLAPRFPDVRWLCNRDNPGYARANNQGLALAQGAHLLLLNPDTEPAPASLATLVTFLVSHPAAGIVGPALLLPDGTPQPYGFGGDPTPAYLLRRNGQRFLHLGSLHDWGNPTAAAVDWVSGACLLLRRAVYEQTRGLDEAMFMYFEDNELCLRVRRAGWQVWREPAARVMHVGGQSLRQNRQAPAAYYASLRYFYAKHYSRTRQRILDLLLRAMPGPGNR
jgi:hypothetical protein